MASESSMDAYATAASRALSGVILVATYNRDDTGSLTVGDVSTNVANVFIACVYDGSSVRPSALDCLSHMVILVASFCIHKAFVIYYNRHIHLCQISCAGVLVENLPLNY
jgi:hypothetical protein